MTDPPQQRQAGYYWISIEGQEAEVAQWQLEWDQWFIVGSELPLPDELASRVVVLSDTLPPPALPENRQAAE